ncbi:MAG: glycosyltransferase family 2 protein, partial [Thermoprotei archaeon]
MAIQTSCANDEGNKPSYQPFISVIITAYNRKEYLHEAIKSVLAQTLPRAQFEVVVVKNFDTPEDDAYKKQGINLIHLDEASYGKKLLAALRVCRGQIICLLDDDDLYLPRKLSFIASTFSRNPRLGYLHHLQQSIDEQGRPLGKIPFGVKPDDLVKTTLDTAHERANALLNPYYWGNDSSIVIRRDILLKYAGFLDKLIGAADNFMFTLALISNSEILCTKEVLSLYREHSNSSSVFFNFKSDFESFCSKSSKFYKKQATDHELMLYLAKGTLFEPIVCLRKAEIDLLALPFSHDSPLKKLLLILNSLKI